MSTLTAGPPTTSHEDLPPAVAQVHPTFAGVMRGEWIKLLSLRSTWWALASTTAVIPHWPRASSRCTAPKSSPAASTSGC